MKRATLHATAGDISWHAGPGRQSSATGSPATARDTTMASLPALTATAASWIIPRWLEPRGPDPIVFGPPRRQRPPCPALLNGIRYCPDHPDVSWHGPAPCFACTEAM